MNDLLYSFWICLVFRQGKSCVTVSFLTLSVTAFKSVSTAFVLLQGIVVQIRMGSGGGLDKREGDCERIKKASPWSAREPCIPPGLGSGTAISRFPCSRQLVLDRSDQVFIIWSKRIRTFACRYQKPMPYHLAILHTAFFWTVERTERGALEPWSRARRTSRARTRGYSK